MSVITGTSGNNNLNGGSGDDIMDGGAGNDTMSGGSGSDIMDGGSGNDRLNGGSGNDTLIYTLAENSGATDIYTGGSGLDTVRLQLTSTEWVRADVQTQIARYLQHLNTVKTNQNTGEVSNGSASDFTFVFNGGTRLTVQMMEKLDVWVDGHQFDFHAPFVTAADDAGAVSEDAASPTLSDTGTINFVDVDWTQSHSATVTPNGGNALCGTLTAVVSNVATGDGNGVVTWNYGVANSATQHLGVGDTASETFTVTITDSSGKTDTQTITVTVTGTNDAPVLTVDTSGGVTEDGADPTLSDTGALSFTDVDVNDSHTVSSAYNNDASWTGGSLTAGQVTAITSGFSADSDSWDYSVANSALQFLGAGESITLSFNVTVTDDSGAGNNADTEVVTLTLTGTNDAPVLTVDTSGGVTEDGADPTLSDTGALSFTDVDVNDSHTVSSAYNNDASWTGGSLTAGQVTAITSGFSADSDSWDYSVANSALQFLGAGESITLSFNVTVTDDSGAGNNADTEVVTLTLTGTNDAPVLTVDTSGGVTEDGADPTLSDTGALSFTDVDVNDSHTVSSAYNNDASWTGGSLTAGQVTAITSGFSADSDSWDYSVANSALQFLGAGESITLSFNVTVTDDSGAGNNADTEVVTLTLTGTNDAPVLTVDTSGGVTEDGADPTLSDTGALSFTDVDVNDSHTVSSAYNNDASWTGGSLTAGQVTAITSGFSADSDSWDYSVANSALQFLGAGESITLSFNVTVTDDSGAGNNADTEVVTLTLTGTNDAPVLTVDTSGGVTEDGADPTLSDTGALSFTDVDVNDSHTVSSAYNNDASWTGGSLTAGQVTAITSGFSADSDSWDYSVANSALQFLGAGESITLSFNVTVTDDSGAGNNADTEVVTLTLTGTNDAPVLTVDTSGGVTEDGADPTLSDTGALSFTDVDVNDSHTVSSAYNNDASWTGGSLTAGQVTAITSGFSADSDSWDYSVANSALQFLGAGESITLSFNVTVTDDSGAGNNADTEVVTLTLTGTNDAPVLTVDTSGGVTEDGADPTLSDTGALSFTDVDVNDSHTVSSAYNNDASWTGGSLTAGQVTAITSGFSADSDSWDYSVANSALQFLGAGESITLSFNVTVTDDSGAGNNADTEVVTLTLTGTNDAPVLTVDTSGGVTEDGADPTLSDTGALSFTDVDVNDSHTVSSAYNNDASWTGGSLTAGQVTAITSGFSADSDSWDYSVANSALQFLGAGESITLSFNVTVTDDSGAGNNADTEVVTLTLTGTNDAPVLTVDTSGGVTEDGADPTLSDTGALSFTDVDVNDSHTVSSAYNNDASWTGGSLTAGQVTAITSGFSADSDSWDYSVANSALQFLGAGESITLSFNVTVTDDSGAGNNADTEVVTLTLTGTNDAPVLNAAATPVLATVAEDAGAPVGAVGTLVSALVNPNPPAGGLDNVTDADNGALTGMAITDTDSSNGTWWYSTNNGGTWTQISPVSNSSALLLAADANTRVYFQGDSNFNGTVSDAITFRAWDQTSGTAGTHANTATNGGSSAFSSETDKASIVVSAANDNPVVIGDRIIVSNSTLVTIPVSALLANDTDIDGLALNITSVGSATGITGLTLNANGTISFTSGATAGATAGSFQYTVSDGAGGTATATVTIDIRTVGTGNGADTVDLSTAGTYQASYIDGRGGADNLTGGVPGDIFIGGTGNGADTLMGGAGNDLLIGGDGNDTLDGGAGNDVLRGGAGNNDSMNGGAGSEDMLDFSDGTSAVTFTLVQSAGSTSIANGTGGLGNNDTYRNMEGVIGTSLGDTLTGSSSNDIIRGGAGNDTLNGAGGTGDLIDFSDGTAGITFTLVNNGVGTVFNASAAGLGTDTYSGFEGVIGTAFADALTGSAAADQQHGGGGNDVISGLAGDDRIIGGAGADTLTGGADNDTFVFDSAPNAVDSITDFDASETAASEDFIELSLAVFSGLTTAAGSTLSSSEFAASDGGGAGDSVGAGVRVIYDSATGNLYYDSDGGSSANRTLVADITLTNPSDTFDYNDIRVGT